MGKSLTFTGAATMVGCGVAVQSAYVVTCLLLQPFCFMALNLLEPFVGVLEAIRLVLTLAAYRHLESSPLPPPPAAPPSFTQAYVAKAGAATRALLSEAPPPPMGPSGPPGPTRGMWEHTVHILTQGNPLDLAATWLTVIQIALSVTVSLYIAGRRLVATAQVAAAMTKMKSMQSEEMKPEGEGGSQRQAEGKASFISRFLGTSGKGRYAMTSGKGDRRDEGRQGDQGRQAGYAESADAEVVVMEPVHEWEQLALVPAHSQPLLGKPSEEPSSEGRSLRSSRQGSKGSSAISKGSSDATSKGEKGDDKTSDKSNKSRESGDDV
jgi:hypothetical protein